MALCRGPVTQPTNVKYALSDFRRTLIGDLLQAKVDLSTVQQMAGHASPLTTVRYDCCGDEARREAVEYLHFPYTRPPQRGKP